MKYLTVLMLAVKAMHLGIEYSDNLKVIQKGRSLVKQIRVKPPKLGIKITSKGIAPISTITKDGFINLFELYEMTPEEIVNTYGHLLKHQSGSKYALTGFDSVVSPITLNALFLMEFHFLEKHMPLAVTKRDYLDDKGSIFKTFNILNMQIKYVVPESIAFTAFLAYENKIGEGNIIVVNTRGKKTVMSLNEVKIENNQGGANDVDEKKFLIKNHKVEVVDGISDNHIKEIIETYLKERILEMMAKKNESIYTELDSDHILSFLPGSLKSGLYCDINTIYRDLLKKLKNGSSTHYIEWIDLYQYQNPGNNTGLEGLNINIEDIRVKIMEFIADKSIEIEKRFLAFKETVKDFQVVILTEFDNFYSLLPFLIPLKINDSESGISKGALYLTYGVFQIEYEGISRPGLENNFNLVEEKSNLDSIINEVKCYQILSRCLKKIGDKRMMEILEHCPETVVSRLQDLLDKNEWNYENAKAFVSDYTEYEKRNNKLKEEAKFRGKYISDLQNMLKNAKSLEGSDEELWKLIKEEYAEIDKWFLENKENDKANASEFKDKYSQLEDSISFFKMQRNKRIEEETEKINCESAEKLNAGEDKDNQELSGNEKENDEMASQEKANKEDAPTDIFDSKQSSEKDSFQNEKTSFSSKHEHDEL